MRLSVISTPDIYVSDIVKPQNIMNNMPIKLRVIQRYG